METNWAERIVEEYIRRKEICEYDDLILEAIKKAVEWGARRSRERTLALVMEEMIEGHDRIKELEVKIIRLEEQGI